MKKIYTLKKWYSVNDTAKRLSETLNEEITPKEILQFYIEDELEIYAYFNNQYAKEVCQASTYTKIKDNPFYKISDYLKSFPDENTILSNQYYQSQKKHIDKLEGFYKLEKKHSDLVKENIASLFLDVNETAFSFNGLIVSDEKNNLYQLAEAFKEEDFKETIKTKKTSRLIYDIENYFPSIEFPKYTNLFFTREHIEEFEHKLTDSNTNKRSDKQLKTDLKILGALLNTILKRGEKRKNPLFSSQNEIITELLELYPNVSGVSKRTLEARFAAAKRLLEEEEE